MTTTPDEAPPNDRSGVLGRIIDWSARNVFLVLLATLFLVGLGVYAVRNTPVDALDRKSVV